MNEKTTSLKQDILRYRQSGLIAGFVAILVVAAVLHIAFGIRFYTLSNLSNLSRTSAILLIVALGQLFVILSGGLDLSVGAVISTVSVFTAAFLDGRGGLILPTVAIALLIGAVIGVANGALVTGRTVQPFIATLGVSIVLRGLRLVYTQGSPKGNIPTDFRGIAIGRTFGIPNVVIFAALLVVVGYIILNRTRYGRRLYVTGCNPSAAAMAGVRHKYVIVRAYVFSSVLAAIGGLMLTAYTGSADNASGSGYDLDSIAAVVLGGAVIGGGIGTVLGAIVGTLIMVVILNLSLLANLPLEAQYIIKFLVLVTAVWLNGRRFGGQQ